MNIKRKPVQIGRTSILVTVFAVAHLALPQPAKAQSTETFYYWVALSNLLQGNPRQSFVVAVESAKAAEIEAIFSKGGRPGLSGQIAAGGVLNLVQFPSLNHQCEITSGVLQKECASLLQTFFKARRRDNVPDA